MHPPVLLCWLALVAAAATPSAPAPALAPELQHLQESLRQTRSVSARFHQTRRWSALKDVLESDGRFQYARGGKMVWHTELPAQSELILEGTSAVMSYPALGTQQTIDFSTDPGMGKVFETIRAVLQADLSVLQPLFVLSIVRTSPLCLQLQPRAPELGRVLKTLRLEFNAQSLLTHVVLTEAAGDVTDIVFRQQAVQKGPG